MNSVLIDTSAWIEALRKQGKVEIREHVKSLLLDGQASWNELILAELWNGAQGVAEKKMVRELENDIPIFSITKEVWQLTYHLAESARTKGRTVPTTNPHISQVSEVFLARREPGGPIALRRSCRRRLGTAKARTQVRN